MATIGKLAVQITADASGLKSGLTDAEKTVSAKADAISASVGRIGAAFAGLGVVAALKNMTVEAINTADAFDEMAEKTGIGVEKLSSLAYAAKINGASVDDLGTAIRALSNRMAESVDPASQAAQMFNGLGVSTREADGSLRGVDDVMMDLAGVFATMRDGAAKSALAMDIFSRSGLSMIPVLNKGKDGLRDLRIEAERMGAVISTDMAKQAAEFNENIDRLGTLSGTLGKTIANALVPELNKLINEFLNGIKYANGFWDALATFGTINPFKDLQGNLKSTREEIDNLNAARERYVKAGSDTSGIDQAIATEKRRLEYLKDIERQQVLNAQGPGNQTEAESRRLGLSKYQGPPPPPPKKDGEAIDDPMGDFIKKQEQAARDRLYVEQEYFAQKTEMLRQSYLTEEELANEKYAKEAERLQAVKDSQMISEQEFTDQLLQLRYDRDQAIMDAEFRLLANQKQVSDERRRNELAVEKSITDAKRASVDAAIGLLSALSGKSKTAAIAAIALSKAVAIGDIIRHTAVAQMHAMAQLGPIAGPAAAASIGTMGKIQAGLVAATGLAQAAGLSDGSSSIASASPLGGGGFVATGQGGGAMQSQGVNQVITIQGIGAGDMFSGDSVRGLIDQLIEAQRNGSKVVLS